ETTAVSDIDFSALFKAVPAEAHFVWISDSCHSGDLARGRFRADAVPRYLPPPPQIMAQIDALLMRGGRKRSLNGVVERLKGLLIAGCQSNETSADSMFEGRGKGAPSFSLLKALRRGEARSEDIETLLGSVQGALNATGYAQHPQLRGLPDLRRKPFPAFPPADSAAPAIAAVANMPSAPVSDTTSLLEMGDGRFWDEALDRAAPLQHAARGEPRWSHARRAAH